MQISLLQRDYPAPMSSYPQVPQHLSASGNVCLECTPTPTRVGVYFGGESPLAASW
jgi:hypothetical protein